MITTPTQCLFVNGAKLQLSKLSPMSNETRGNFSDEEWKALADAWKQEARELFDAAKKIREVFGEGTKITYIGPIRKAR